MWNESEKNALLDAFAAKIEETGTEIQKNSGENGRLMILADHRELSLSGEDAVGCYYFLPEPKIAPEDMPEGEDKIGMVHFVMNLTVRDAVDPLISSMLREQLTRLNYILPFGGFVIPPDDGAVSFRYVLSIPSFSTKEHAVSEMLWAAILAMQSTGRWMDLVNDLADGAIGVREFKKEIGEIRE